MSRIWESCTSWAKKLAPWALAALVPVACSARSADENLGEVSSALTTTLGLTADSYVRSNQASSNFGSTTTLYADGSDGGGILHTYVRFTVGDVGTISNVKLRLFVKDTTSQTYNVVAVADDSWGESTITWGNKPATGVTLTSFTATTDEAFKELDITSGVQPNSTISLAIVPASGTTNGVDFRSKEASNSGERPQVVITSNGTGGTGGSGGGGSGGSSGGGTGGTAGSAGTAGSGGVAQTVSTDANLKIAFVGDTSDGTSWASVLQLILAEGAHAVMVQGDMTYDSDPSGWWSRTEGVVGQSYPVFLARGNHDDGSWGGFLTEAGNHLGAATRIAGPHDSAYKTVFRGLAIGTIKKGDTNTTVNNLFNGDNHVWRICNWHQNQNKMQVGGKGDEMGWGVYEACRQLGAIIQTGHEHTYHRTKTMTNTQNQVIDANCSSGSSVCVGPGRTFVTVSGCGGNGLRAQIRCAPTAASAPFPSLNTSDPSCPIWASIYTTNQNAQFGAQFITFNVDGNPKKARGYFKNVGGATIDSFDIFAD